MEIQTKLRAGNAGRSPLETLWAFSSAYALPTVLAALTFWFLSDGAHTLQKVIEYYTPLPMWDYWRVVDHLSAYQSCHWAVFWRQHNEHRIVFPEIAFALDMVLLHGRMLLPLILSTLCYVGTWLLLASALFPERSIPIAIRFVAVLLSGIVAFSESAAGALAIPFLLQWTSVQLAAAVALVSTSKLRNRHSAKYLALAISACTVASYSSANGLALWPLIIAFATIVGGSKRDVLALSVSAAIAIGLFFLGYHFTGHLKLGTAVGSPFYLIQYVASYLSMPFGGMRTPSFGVKVGVCFLCAVFALTLVAARTRRLTWHPVAVLLGYFCFTVMTAVLTAGGRMDTADPTFTAAHAFRYLTVPQMNWAAGVLLLFAVISPLGKVRKYVPAAASGIALLLFVAFPKLSPWLGGVTSYLTEQQIATLEIESGLHDSHWIETKLYPDVDFVQAMLSRLKAQKLSIYYDGRTRFLGRPLTSVAFVRPGEKIPGKIVAVTRVQSGFELRGWVDQPGRKLSAASLLFTDESGKIVGLGQQFSAGFPPVLASPDLPPSLAWAGFIAGDMHPTFISAYVQAPRGNAVFPLGQPAPVSP